MTALLQIMAGAQHGGAESFFTRLGIALQRAGLNQHLVIREDAARAAQLRAGGASVSELPFHGLLDLRTRFGLRRLVREHAPGVVLSWMNRATKLTPSGPFTHVARLGGYYDLKYYRHCDHLIGNTQDIVAYLRREGWPANQAHYLPNFVAEAAVPAYPRVLLDTPADAPLVLALGRLHPVKGFDVLLSALARVPGAWLWLAGEGPERNRLERQADALGISRRVRFLGWRDDTAALMAAADLLVCPSRHEPLGNVVIEAWAHRLPVLASDAEGPRELIRPGIDGLLVPREDADALAGMIQSLLAHEEARTALVGAGFDSYARQFSEPIVVAAYRDFIEKVAR